MTKAYSTKALPPGTVLREWRLEEVLGVGGFGIVYKGRGIYFGELVAIKEYFPSSISERNEDDTVVPVDSDSEEVHALGLKKFVEEAKLLWNLSTPTRHPNIVNVRSLFEVHGTAYMVMDFEDGVSLSRMLKKEHRFNEASLSNLIKPIAEGLERAHRVGVLHRDIKPPNILVNEDGKPVLIDFGSARFESADATSTKVTFHTPPYAAIEQYVKTYDQGPWTDIYALGVVLYQCVTGEKPADVLERLHGGDETRLVDGNWPGYSRAFLAAIDAAMTIKPADRPQSIPAWLALFEGTGASVDPTVDDDDATRMVAYSQVPDEIVPVAPALPGFPATEKPLTNVPDDPKQVRFKLSGQEPGDTSHSNAGEAVAPEDLPRKPDKIAPAAKADAASARNKKATASATSSASGKPARRLGSLAIGTAVVAIAAVGGGWLMFGRDRPARIDSVQLGAKPRAAPLQAAGMVPNDLSQPLKALLADAREFGAPRAVIERLALAAGEAPNAVMATSSGSAPNAATPAAAPLLNDQSVMAETSEFTAGLLRDGEQKERQLVAALPWANAANPRAARLEPAGRQAIAKTLSASLRSLRSAAERKSATPTDGFAVAGQALTAWKSLSSATQAAYRSKKAIAPKDLPTDNATNPAVAATAAPQASPSGVSSGKKAQFDAIVSRTRQLVSQIDQMPMPAKPRSSASTKDKQAYEFRSADKKAARNYDRYLDRLVSSMRGAKSDAEVDQFTRQALQTEDYLRTMLSRAR